MSTSDVDIDDTGFDAMDSMMDSRFLRGGADVMSEERDSLKMVLHDRNFANPIRGVLEAAFPARPVPRCTGQTASNSSTAGAE